MYGQALHLRPPTMQDAAGTQHTVCLPVDCRGILVYICMNTYMCVYRCACPSTAGAFSFTYV